jgi:putative transposase
MILKAVVHPADVQDRIGAQEVLERAWSFRSLRRIFADGGYTGKLVEWTQSIFHKAVLEIVPRLGEGFQVLPKRWIVERTFAWFLRFRRLSKDYEVKMPHSEAFIYIAAARLMLRRLAKSAL